MNDYIVRALILVSVLISYGLGAWAGHEQGYYDGQIDVINGTIKYELVVQKDGSSSWEKVK